MKVKSLSMVTQKNAVFSAICSVLGYSSFTSTVYLTPSERLAVQTQLISGFKSGNIAYKGDSSDEKKLLSYVRSLISNWLRKDHRLNGGVSNSTSRLIKDDTVDAMKTLAGLMEEDEARREIEEEIERRISQKKVANS